MRGSHARLMTRLLAPLPAISAGIPSIQRPRLRERWDRYHSVDVIRRAGYKLIDSPRASAAAYPSGLRGRIANPLFRRFESGRSLSGRSCLHENLTVDYVIPPCGFGVQTPRRLAVRCCDRLANALFPMTHTRHGCPDRAPSGDSESAWLCPGATLGVCVARSPMRLAHACPHLTPPGQG